jgi:hypothetical protein
MEAATKPARGKVWLTASAKGRRTATITSCRGSWF